MQKNNQFQMLALDHYSSIVDKVGRENLAEFKEDVLTALGAKASAVLLDVEYGLPAYKKSGIDTPFILKADPKGDSPKPNLAPKEAQAYGASALKFLSHSPLSQKEVICAIAKESQQENLPFILEILPSQEEFEEIVMEIIGWGAPFSIYKLPYPGSPEKCERITLLLGNTPWVILSRGDSFKSFLKKYRAARQNGAAGFLAGRSLWKEALALPRRSRQEFLASTASVRFQKLLDVK